jgi:hypothetical protein
MITICNRDTQQLQLHTLDLRSLLCDPNRKPLGFRTRQNIAHRTHTKTLAYLMCDFTSVRTAVQPSTLCYLMCDSPCEVADAADASM